MDMKNFFCQIQALYGVFELNRLKIKTAASLNMKVNVTVIVGITAGSLGIICGALLPKPIENYGLAVVTGTTEKTPVMKEYAAKLKPLLDEAGCTQITRDYDTLFMEGRGGPMTVIVGCKDATENEGVAFYKSPEYQELIKLRTPYTNWQFRLVQGKI